MKKRKKSFKGLWWIRMEVHLSFHLISSSGQSPEVAKNPEIESKSQLFRSPAWSCSRSSDQIPSNTNPSSSPCSRILPSWKMEKVMNMIKPKPNPQQQLRDWQRRLRQECRNIERQIRGNFWSVTDKGFSFWGSSLMGHLIGLSRLKPFDVVRFLVFQIYRGKRRMCRKP